MKKKITTENPSSHTQSKVYAKPARRSRTLLYFILRFAVMFLLFEACYFNEYLYQHIFYPVNKLFAFTTVKVLSLLGIKAASNLETISNPQFSMSVKQGCDSIEALAIYICGVLAFPSRLKIKITGLLIGSFIILFMNLVRLVHLFWIGLYHPDLFELFHLEIWQGFFIILSIILWVLWVLKAVKSPKITDHA